MRPPRIFRHAGARCGEEHKLSLAATLSHDVLASCDGRSVSITRSLQATRSKGLFSGCDRTRWNWIRFSVCGSRWLRSLVKSCCVKSAAKPHWHFSRIWERIFGPTRRARSFDEGRDLVADLQQFAYELSKRRVLDTEMPRDVVLVSRVNHFIWPGAQRRCLSVPSQHGIFHRVHR